MDDATYAELMGKLSEIHATQQQQLKTFASLDAGVQALLNVIERLLNHTQKEYARDVALAESAPRHPWS